MHAVDITPIFQYVNEFIGLILAGLAAFVVQKLLVWLQAHVKFLNQQTDAVLANGLNTALQNGIAIAMNKIGGVEAAHSTVEVKGALTAMAARYAVSHAPEAIAHFGLDPTELANKALAYLPPPDAVMAAATIVTTPVPSPAGQTNAQEVAETERLNAAQLAKGGV